MHILFSPTGSDATGCHRIIYPLRALPSSDFTIEILNLSQIDEQLGRADLILLQCLIGPQQHQLISKLRNAGKPIIIDYDDDMSSLPEVKLQEIGMSQRDITANWTRYLDSADLITVTTEMLARAVKRFTSTPITVLPNLIRKEDYELTELYDPFDEDQDIRILFTASESHKKDFNFIKPILKFLGEHYPTTIISHGKLDFIYSCPGYRGQAMHIPLCDYGSYYQRLMELKPHVIIAPLRATPLNICRSNLKFLQAGVLKAAFIATNLAPYQGISKDEAILTETRLGWWWQLRKLIKNKNKARALGLNAHKQTRNYILEDHIHLWINTYNNLYASRHTKRNRKST
jgi:hypothetical protein